MRKLVFIAIMFGVATSNAQAIGSHFEGNDAHWTFEQSEVGGWPGTSDFDGDGAIDMVISTGLFEDAGPILVFTFAGDELWSYQLMEDDVCPDCTDYFDFWLQGFVDVDGSPGKEAIIQWQGSDGGPGWANGLVIVSTFDDVILCSLPFWRLQFIADADIDGKGDLFVDFEDGVNQVLALWGLNGPDPLPCQVATPMSTVTAAGSVLDVRPNPTSRGVVVPLRLDRSADLELRVFDVQGRELRRIPFGSRGVGTHTIEWDGRDQAGRTVAAGTYVLSVVIDDVPTSRKMTIVR